MHIWNSLKGFLYDCNDFITYFNNSIYLYNFININRLDNNVVSLKFKDKNVIINGSNLSTVRCLKNELIIKGKIESILINE